MTILPTGPRCRTAVLALLLPFLSQRIVAQAVPDSSGRQRPATKLQEIVTTASRVSEMVSQSPINVTAVSRRDIATTPASTVPSLLWRLPGFTMRDHQSASANSPGRRVPSFRGLAGSSGGRTLILVDGVPLNDGFNGYMQWNRIPLALVDRVEVIRGGGSMIWGSRALGGVVNILTRTPASSGVEAQVEGGTGESYRGTVTGNVVGSRAHASLTTDWAGTDGFLVTRPDLRGPVDVPSGDQTKVVAGRVGYDVTSSLQATASGSYFDLDSRGPTPGGGNTSSASEFRGGLRWLSPAGGVWSLQGYTTSTDYLNNSGIVSSDRTTETPNRVQAQAATMVAASLQWSQSLGGRHQVAAGLDLSNADGTIDELGNSVNGVWTLNRANGGQQRLGGLFLQDNVRLSERWQVQAAVRGDQIRNTGGYRLDTALPSGTPTLDTSYANVTRSRVNYSVGVRFEATSRLTWRAATYTALRAPTLYELYQTNYSTRGAVIAANPSLRPETLRGVELGVDFQPSATSVLRLNAFLNKAQDAILDYTIGTSTANGQVFTECGAVPRNQACRQRRNVAGLRTIGLESEFEVHPTAAWSIWASYTYNPTRVDAPGDAIDGLPARAAAKHAATASVTYDQPRLATITFEQRYVGPRADDDLNTITLDHFFVSGLRVSRRIAPRTTAYVKVENLFDADYEVTRSTNGYAEVAMPRWIMVGMRSAW
jgi:outer membrane receptor protein involved in Fe transport